MSQPHPQQQTETNSPMSIVWRDKADPLVYERARVHRVFNHQRPQRYPRAIFFVKTQSDIVRTVELAIDQKCTISVRAGGHSWPVWSLRDDSIVVDLGDYSELNLNEGTGVVRASPSTTSKELSDYLSSRGLMFPAGHCPDVGIGGFLLCGGMGWNSNNLGWACQHIVAVDVVTASGEVIQANNEQHSDLLWAARGAGPGFPGIVTRFHLQTQLAPQVMRSSLYVYKMNDYKKAFNWMLKIPSGVDEGLEIAAIGSYPAGFDESCITIALLAVGDNAETVQEVLQRVDSSHPDGLLFRKFCEETSWSQQFKYKADAYPQEQRYCADNAFLDNDRDIATILERAFSTLPTNKSLALYNSMIPTSRRELPSMALSVQSDHYFALYSIWKDEKDDACNQGWVSDIMKDVSQHSVGSYTGEFDFESRLSRFWGDGQKNQLSRVRRKWDPDGLFCGYLGLEDGI